MKNTNKKAAAKVATKKSFFRSKKGIILTSIVSLILVGGLVTGLLLLLLPGNRYEKAIYADYDMSDYITLSRDQYYGLSLSLTGLREITDTDVTDFIEYLRKQVGATKPETLTGGSIQDGDTVSIFYRGVCNGVEFFGGSNMTDASPTKLTIGSNQFVRGFEAGLVGLNPEDTKVTTRTGSEDLVGDPSLGANYRGTVIHVSFDYKYTDANGKQNSGSTSERVDLNDSASRFPADLRERFIGKKIKETLTLPEGYAIPLDLTGDGVAETVTLSNVKVLRIVTEEITYPITLTMPTDYKEESLAGKEVTFYVVVTQISRPTLPEVNYEFVNTDLGLTYESVMAFPPAGGFTGSTEQEKTVEGLPGYVKDFLKEDRTGRLDQDAVYEMWETIYAAAVVKEVPDALFNYEYEELRKQAESGYNSYKGYYGYTSVDDFVLDYYASNYPDIFTEGVSATDGLKALAKQYAEREMIVYYVLQEEKIDLTNKEIETDYPALLQQYQSSYYQQSGYQYSLAQIEEMLGAARLYGELLYSKATKALYDATTVSYPKNYAKLTFDNNGGIGTLSDLSLVPDEAEELPECTFSKKGMTFAGWSTTAGGAVEYTDKASFTIGAEDVTLYAVWTPAT